MIIIIKKIRIIDASEVLLNLAEIKKHNEATMKITPEKRIACKENPKSRSVIVVINPIERTTSESRLKIFLKIE